MHHYPLKCIDNDTQRFRPREIPLTSSFSPLYAISKSVSVKRACKFFFFTVVSVYSSLVPITFVTCISNARGDEMEVFFLRKTTMKQNGEEGLHSKSTQCHQTFLFSLPGCMIDRIFCGCVCAGLILRYFLSFDKYLF